jgi:hypothetical protein
MSKSHYMKDTKKFWQIRNETRVALDKKRTQTPLSQKAKIAEKLRSDAEFLRSGVPVSSKK